MEKDLNLILDKSIDLYNHMVEVGNLIQEKSDLFNIKTIEKMSTQESLIIEDIGEFINGIWNEGDIMLRLINQNQDEDEFKNDDYIEEDFTAFDIMSGDL